MFQPHFVNTIAILHDDLFLFNRFFLIVYNFYYRVSNFLLLLRVHLKINHYGIKRSDFG